MKIVRTIITILAFAFLIIIVYLKFISSNDLESNYHPEQKGLRTGLNFLIETIIMYASFAMIIFSIIDYFLKRKIFALVNILLLIIAIIFIW